MDQLQREYSAKLLLNHYETKTPQIYDNTIQLRNPSRWYSWDWHGLCFKLKLHMLPVPVPVPEQLYC